MKELKMIYSVKLRIKINLWNKIEKIIIKQISVIIINIIKILEYGVLGFWG